MSAFSIMGRLALDTTAFTRGLAGAKNSVGPAASQIGQQFKGKLLEALGAGALIATTKATLQKAFDVRRESGRSGVGTEEYQTLKRIADQTGESVDVLAEKLRVAKLEGGSFADDVKRASDELLAMGVIIADDKIQNLANLFQKIADITATMAPAIAGLLDGFLQFQKIGTGVFESLIGNAQMFYGMLTGKSHLIEAGQQMMSEAGQPQEASSAGGKTAVDSLKEQIARDREVEQWWKDVGGDEAQKERKKGAMGKFERPTVSSLTQVGGYANSAIAQRRQVDDDVHQIRTLVQSLLTVSRERE